MFYRVPINQLKRDPVLSMGDMLDTVKEYFDYDSRMDILCGMEQGLSGLINLKTGINQAIGKKLISGRIKNGL